jgi:hypothetical protein
LSFVLLGLIVSGTLAFDKSPHTISAVPIVSHFRRAQPPLPTGNQ